MRINTSLCSHTDSGGLRQPGRKAASTCESLTLLVSHSLKLPQLSTHFGSYSYKECWCMCSFNKEAETSGSPFSQKLFTIESSVLRGKTIWQVVRERVRTVK